MVSACTSSGRGNTIRETLRQNGVCLHQQLQKPTIELNNEKIHISPHSLLGHTGPQGWQFQDTAGANMDHSSLLEHLFGWHEQQTMRFSAWHEQQNMQFNVWHEQQNMQFTVCTCTLVLTKIANFQW
eukprot:scaffold40019_cov22-Tisochrysis_lutea.AAC.1